MKHWLTRALILTVMPLLLVGSLAVLWQLKPIAIKSDMLALLTPIADAQSGDKEALDKAQNFYLAQQQLLGEQQKRLVFSLQGANSEQAYRDLAQGLAHAGLKVQGQQPQLTQIIDFYAPYRGALMSQEYAQAIGEPAKFNQYFQRQLAQTASPWLSQSLSQDMSLATYSFVSTLSNEQALALVDGKLQGRDEQGEPVWILLAQTNESVSSIAATERTVSAIDALLNQLRQDHPQVQISHSGLLFHNAENATQAKWEMNRFGLASIVLLSMFVFLSLRGVWPLWVSMLTVSTAILSGLLALLLLRPEIHLLTLVFATTLIGVAIDYAFHALVDKAAHKGRYSRALKRGLLLALCSTAIGYLCFLSAPLVLLQDVAIFVVAGLIGAWVFTRFCLAPVAMTLSFRAPVVSSAERALQWQGQARRHSGKVYLGLAVLCVLLSGWRMPETNDSIASFNASSAELMAAQAQHQIYLQGSEPVQRLLLKGQDVQQLLRREEQVSAWLRQLGAHTQGLSSALPSLARQQENAQAYNRAVAAGVFAPLQAFSGKVIAPTTIDLLDYDAFAMSPLRAAFAELVHLDGEVYSLLNVSGVSAAQLQAIGAEHDYVAIVDVPGQLSAMLAHFHRGIHLALFLAAVAIVLIFVFSFGWRHGLKMAAWLALSTALIVSLIAQFSAISVFHTLGLILVLALAVDYFIFYRQGGHSAHTLVAISLSALSSLAVFAMLIFSKTPAISQFGGAVLLGLLVVYFLAPLSIENNNDKQ
ncbi:MMPL family transporter [Pseudoalteromonas sp. T1lg48]|uniref:MMPL family transporter n=1 Tax=Pseudoalteromonas sp. T1lg48 TaxID=2077100 RepID=UPI000CF69558|nr:hypothetical protein [Pseudoalteromonas sp. T1lg48]